MDILSENWELLGIFFSIALVYSSVGFGGGSSYLAILAWYAFDQQMLRATALLCNITVVTGGVFIFLKNKLLPLRKVLPLVALSVPFSYLGGRLILEQRVFFILLGLVLISAAILLFFKTYKADNQLVINNESNILRDASIGGSIGFLSGLVGIGGGIFLAPLLHLWAWEHPKKIAATASFFILVNSIAGLIGQATSDGFDLNIPFVVPMMMSVFLGGQIGSRLSIHQFSARTVKLLTGVLILYVGVRILWKYLP